MLYVIGAIALVSMVLNVFLYKKLSVMKVPPIVEQVTEPIEPIIEETFITIETVKDVYLSRALPSRPTVTPGPLERPGGFPF